jgi:hypothetical protein
VPHVVLIDTEGKIAFVGHPASTDLEKGIEKLLKGEKLGAAGGDDDEEGGEGFKELDLANVHKEMTTFSENLSAFKANEALKSVQLMRDFVVLIRETKYDVAADKYLTNFRNINVLVGPGGQVEKAKQEIEGFLMGLGATYKSEWRVQKM